VLVILEPGEVVNSDGFSVVVKFGEVDAVKELGLELVLFV